MSSEGNRRTSYNILGVVLLLPKDKGECVGSGMRLQLRPRTILDCNGGRLGPGLQEQAAVIAQPDLFPGENRTARGNPMNMAEMIFLK